MKNTNTTYANNIIIRHLVLLYITTFGLYFFYWFYQTNKQLYGHQGIDNKPALRTLGLIIPLLNIYLLWVFFSDTQKFTRNGFQYPGWLTVAFIVSSALYRLPSLFSFIGFISVLPVIVVQKTLNAYWKKEQPDLPEKTQLSWVEILICCLGAIILIMAAIGIGLSPPSP